MKIFSRPLSWIYLLIPGLLFLISFIISAPSGGLLGLYLIGIIACLPCLCGSTGWVRWVAVALVLFFAIATYSDHQDGMRYSRLMGEKAAKIKGSNR